LVSKNSNFLFYSSKSFSTNRKLNPFGLNPLLLVRSFLLVAKMNPLGLSLLLLDLFPRLAQKRSLFLAALGPEEFGTFVSVWEILKKRII